MQYGNTFAQLVKRNIKLHNWPNRVRLYRHEVTLISIGVNAEYNCCWITTNVKAIEAVQGSSWLDQSKVLCTSAEVLGMQVTCPATELAKLLIPL